MEIIDFYNNHLLSDFKIINKSKSVYIQCHKIILYQNEYIQKYCENTGKMNHANNKLYIDDNEWDYFVIMIKIYYKVIQFKDVEMKLIDKLYEIMDKYCAISLINIMDQHIKTRIEYENDVVELYKFYKKYMDEKDIEYLLKGIRKRLFHNYGDNKDHIFFDTINESNIKELIDTRDDATQRYYDYSNAVSNAYYGDNIYDYPCIHDYE